MQQGDRRGLAVPRSSAARSTPGPGAMPRASSARSADERLDRFSMRRSWHANPSKSLADAVAARKHGAAHSSRSRRGTEAAQAIRHSQRYLGRQQSMNWRPCFGLARPGSARYGKRRSFSRVCFARPVQRGVVARQVDKDLWLRAMVIATFGLVAAGTGNYKTRPMLSAT